VESGDSRRVQSLVKKETKWVFSILKLSKFPYTFMSYSELEETTASFPKFSGKFSIVFLHFSQILHPFQRLGTVFIFQCNTGPRFFLELAL
jgi:hypothetical protein